MEHQMMHADGHMGKSYMLDGYEYNSEVPSISSFENKKLKKLEKDYDKYYAQYEDTRDELEQLLYGPNQYDDLAYKSFLITMTRAEMMDLKNLLKGL